MSFLGLQLPSGTGKGDQFFAVAQLSFFEMAQLEFYRTTYDMARFITTEAGLSAAVG